MDLRIWGSLAGFRNCVAAVVQSLSRVQLFSTPWTAARQASLSFTLSRSSLRLTSVESVMPPTVSPSGPFPSCLLLWLHVSEMYQKSLSCILEVGEFEGVSLF